MQAQALEASVRSTGNTAIIDLKGDIDGGSETALQAAYSQAAALSPTGILLSFENVSYINSTGIALIVGLLAKARADRLPLLTSGLSEHYTHIFTITRLSDFMAIYPDEATALASQQAA
ncbi:MAG: STAS domain-containing protein [Caldilineales bacterium]|nr:STAS domain-containing protein [Caldilineales bacterium]